MKRITFQLISDVHLEHFYARNLAANAARRPEQTVELMRHDFVDVPELQSVIASLLVPSADYLIVAGDLTDMSTFMTDADAFQPPYADVLTLFFSHYAAHFRRIFYVLGNHEYYRTVVGLDGTLPFYRQRIARINGEIGREAVTLLENDAALIEHDGRRIHVLGATMWSAVTSAASLAMNDYQRIRDRPQGAVRDMPISWRDTLALHEASRAWLERTLSELIGDDPVVVVTHHLPSLSLCDPRYAGFETTPAFASELSGIVAAHPRIAAWAFGHTHHSVRAPPYYCNPRGYPDGSTFENTAFDQAFTFAIGE